MKSWMTVTEALKERELLKKRITKKIGQLGSGADSARHGIESAASASARRDVASDGATALCDARFDAALQQIQDLILRYDAISGAVARSNAETWLDTSRGYMTVSEAVALRSRLSDKEAVDTAFEQQLTERLESIVKKQKELLENSQNPSGHHRALKGNIVILQNPSAGSHSGGGKPKQEPKQLRPAFSAQKLAKIRGLTESIQESREELLLELDTKLALSNAATWIDV